MMQEKIKKEDQEVSFRPKINTDKKRCFVQDRPHYERLYNLHEKR